MTIFTGQVLSSFVEMLAPRPSQVFALAAVLAILLGAAYYLLSRNIRTQAAETA